MSDYSTSAIIEFDALFDTDFGKVRWIRDNINKFSDLNMNIVNADNYFLRVMLYTMPIRDVPLLIGMSEDTYKEVFEDRKNLRKAYELSPKTTILDLSEIYSSTGGIISTAVLCKTPLEEHFIKRISPDTRTIVGKYDVNLSLFDVIYVKEFADILKYVKFKRFNGKEVVIPDFWYNMDPIDHTKPNMDVALTISDTNKIKTICPYKKFVLPAEE